MICCTERKERRMGKREDNRAEKERTILEVAERLFLEKGLEETNMNRIAEACGMSKGLLFYYFGSKDRLALAILWKHTAEEMDSIFRELEHLRGDGRAKIARLFSSILTQRDEAIERLKPLFRMRQYILNRVLSGSMEKGDLEVYQEIFVTSVKPFELLIAEGQRDGSIRPDVIPFEAAVRISVPLGAALEYHAAFRHMKSMRPILSIEQLMLLLDVMIGHLKPKEI